MLMGKVKKRKNSKISKDKCKKIWLWLIMTLSLAIVMGILHGTVEHYFDTTKLVFGLYMDWEQFFVVIGVATWTVLTVIIFKGGVDFKK